MKQKTKYENSLESNFFEKQIRKKAIPPNQIQRANTREPKHPPPLETSLNPSSVTSHRSNLGPSTLDTGPKIFFHGKNRPGFLHPPLPIPCLPCSIFGNKSIPVKQRRWRRRRRRPSTRIKRGEIYFYKSGRRKNTLFSAGGKLDDRAR